MRYILKILLPFILTSLLLSSFYYYQLSFPLYNLAGAIGLNMLVYTLPPLSFLFLGAVLFPYYKKIKTNLTVLLFLLFNLLFLSSLFSIISKLSWGHILTIQMLWDIFFNINKFISSSPVNLPSLLVGFTFFQILLFYILYKNQRYYPNVIQYIRRQSFRNKAIGATGFLLLTGCFIFSERGNRILYNHASQNDHVLVMYFSSFQNAINVNFNQLKNLNIEEYKAAYKQKISPTEHRKNVILFIVDALRGDHLSMNGYPRKITPFLDSLYENGKLINIKNTFSTCANSPCGILSILGSKDWEHLGLFNFQIQDVLKQAGYQNYFFLSGLHSSWYNIGKQYMTNLDFYFEGINSEKYDANDDRILLEGWSHADISSDNQNFMYFHLMSCHFFGIRQEKFNRYLPFESRPFSTFEEKLIRYRNFYDNGILQADDIIRRIFEKLETSDLLKNTIVIITADHGESLGEKGLIGHTESLWNAELNIPFLIYGADQTMVDTVVHKTHVDISPTIASLVGLQPPEVWQGNSVFNPSDQKISYHTQSDMQSVIFSDGSHFFKLIRNARSGESYLFNLAVDLAEDYNLYDNKAYTNIQNQLEAYLRQHYNFEE